MQERNIINGTTTALVSPLLDFYENLIPFLLLAIVLIFVDSRFGVAAARKRGEKYVDMNLAVTVPGTNINGVTVMFWAI